MLVSFIGCFSQYSTQYSYLSIKELKSFVGREDTVAQIVTLNHGHLYSACMLVVISCKQCMREENLLYVENLRHARDV